MIGAKQPDEECWQRFRANDVRNGAENEVAGFKDFELASSESN